MEDKGLDLYARDHRDGNAEALRPLVEALTRPLISVAYRYVGDWETARDLTQETWLRVHRSIGRWDPARPVRPWIFSIHRNVCLDHLRHRAVMTTNDHELTKIEDAHADPLAQAMRTELSRRVRDALNDLGEIQRRVVVMVDLEELRPSEVATTLGMNPTTVRTTLHFARKKLARLLEQETS